MNVEELDISAQLIIEEHGVQLAREEFDAIASSLAPTLGDRDRLWARYLIARSKR